MSFFEWLNGNVEEAYKIAEEIADECIVLSEESEGGEEAHAPSSLDSDSVDHAGVRRRSPVAANTSWRVCLFVWI